GACHGRLLAELPGTTVACPHCGTHLQTPAAEPSSQPEQAVVIESGDGSSSGPDPQIDTVRMDFWVPSEPLYDATVAAEPFTFVPPVDAGPPFPGAPEIVAAAAAEIPSPVASVNPAEDRVDSTVATPTADIVGAANVAGEV